jgi:hypothetical protein
LKHELLWNQEQLPVKLPVSYRICPNTNSFAAITCNLLIAIISITAGFLKKNQSLELPLVHYRHTWMDVVHCAPVNKRAGARNEPFKRGTRID